jgi:transporter family protein
LGSAAFAAPTAIFAKAGVEGINADLATFIRTAVVLMSYFRALKLDPAKLVAPVDKLSVGLVALSGSRFSASGPRRPDGPESRSWPPVRS